MNKLLISKIKIMNHSKVWFVTGASQGFGLTLVKKLLRSGYRVAATSRDSQKLRAAVEIGNDDYFLPLSVDLHDMDSLNKSIQQTVSTFGTIDVVVNNAGYGMMGSVEEISETDVRKIFDVNVIAAINVTKMMLPIMRKQKSGYFINMGSVAGFVGAPGWSIYSATKAAIAAFSEVLALDLKEFGIKVTVVEPAGFRTGFLTEESIANIATSIDGYEAIKVTRERYLAMNGKQPGDPEKASEIFIELAESAEPPLHLYLGHDAYIRASVKLAAMNAELEAWKTATMSADFNEPT